MLRTLAAVGVRLPILALLHVYFYRGGLAICRSETGRGRRFGVETNARWLLPLPRSRVGVCVGWRGDHIWAVRIPQKKNCFYENLTGRARFKPKLYLIYLCIYINGTQEPTLLMSKYRIARQGEERTSSPVH